MNSHDQFMSETLPLVSVIICFYNEAYVLSEAIDSVLNQDYPNTEIILVNDGSSDSSEEIAISYQTRYLNKCTICNHPGKENLGLSASRNLGIRHAKGDWICFLDADDVIFPSKISAQLALARLCPEAEMIAGSTLYNYSQMPQKIPNAIVPVGTNQNKLFFPPDLLFDLYPIGTGQAPCMHSLFVKRSVLEATGGFENAFRGMYEDQVFLTKVYLNCAVFITEACHCEYRLRPGSMMHRSQNQEAYRQIRQAYLIWAERYIQMHRPEYASLISLIKNHRRNNQFRWVGWMVQQGRYLLNIARKMLSGSRLHII